MKTSTRSGIRTAILSLGLIALFAVLGAYPSSALLQSQRNVPPPTGYIQGVVQSEKGPEAGVWVIAETKDLPTNFIKIVVTDDQGRFMVPDLPTANYKVWVRGYGLVDSTPINMKPAANTVTLKAATAKTPQEAAAVYPGDYWLSHAGAAGPEPVPRHRQRKATASAPRWLTQNHWINSLKSDCNFCHQLGNQLTRSVDHVFKANPELKTHEEAWEWRLGTGVRGNNMYSVLNNHGHRRRSLKVFADWTERVAKGEVPPAPPRPKGIERNIVADAVGLWATTTRSCTTRSPPTRTIRRSTAAARCTRCRPVTARWSSWIRSENSTVLDRYPDARSQGQGSVAFPGAESPVVLVGQRASVGESAVQPGRSAQPDDRQQRPRVDDVEDSRQPGAGVVQ